MKYSLCCRAKAMSKIHTSVTSVAFLCDRLGPYHIARLNAANKHIPITAIEFSAKDQTYAWDCIADTGSFQRVTLFNDKPITMQTSSTVVNRIRSVLNELRPQVVAIPGWDAPASLIALWWCLETNTSTVLMSDSQEHDEPRVWWKEAIKGRVVKLHSSGFVGGTPHRAYLKSLGMEETRIVTGVDVVDNAFFSEGAETARKNVDSVRQRFSLPEQYFLVSCRFIQKKNLLAVLRAYAKYRLAAGDEAWKLVLLGDGPLKQQIISLREELGLVEMVLMPGFKQYAELPIYYGLAGAFILASTSEQWGLVVNEAMASGLPIIVSSPCGSAPDLVIYGHNGFTFDPTDNDALSQYLAILASDENQRAAMGNACRKIIENWGLDLFAGNLCKAADMALKAPHAVFSYSDKVLLWSLIYRKRSR
jgi:glycosyltransferase involved in cell wall biosynthesis